jgi:4'-phosphopantetheinyl transferase
MLPEYGIEVVVTRDSPDPDTVIASAGILSENERQRAHRFLMEQDRQRFVMRRARLRKLLGERLGVSGARVHLSTGIHGKPALAAPLDRSGITFNLSHSGDLTVYAFASHTDVGIDVEAIRGIEAVDRLAAIAFSPLEFETYERLPPEDRLIGFLNGWTRKEAFVKATGTGLCQSLNSFDVSLAPDEPARLLRIGTRRGNAGWLMRSFCPAPGFIAAIAARAA